MLIKRSMLCVSLLCATSLAQASAPVQEQGFLSALASDTVSAVKWIGTGIGAVAQGIGNTYLLAREYPKSALAIAVAVPVLGRWIYVNNYNEYIKPIADRARGNDRRFSNWKTTEWKNSAVLVRKSNEALNSFKSDFKQEFEDDNSRGRLIESLKQEIEAISVDMDRLEKSYLICKAPLEITLYDIKKEFQSVCNKCAEEVGETALSVEQFKAVQKEFIKAIKAKVFPYLLFSINYKQAALLWWKLKKKQLRLQVLLHNLNPVIEGNSNIPNKQRTLSEHQAGVHATTSYDQA